MTDVSRLCPRLVYHHRCRILARSHLKPTLWPTRAFRLARLALHVALGVLVAWLVFPRVSQARQDRILRWWGRGVLRALQVTPVVRGALPGLAVPVLLVANHISWLDVFAVHAVKPVRWVAKADIRSWPVLGWLCARTGTLFIERDRARHTVHVIHAMRSQLQSGASVGIFPEGTSSFGDFVRAFHAALLQAAPEDGTVAPLALRYLDSVGQPTIAAAYAGELTMKECIRNILSQSRLTVELNFEELLQVSGRSRRELAAAAENAIAQRLGVPVLRNQPETAGDPPA